MSLFKQFATDENVEKDGIILDYGHNSKGEAIQIRIARAGGSNTKFTKVLERKIKPYRRQIQNETMEEDVALKLQREVYAETVILGWTGVEDKEGNPLPYNRDNVIALLTALPELFTDIREQATRVALFRAEIREIEAKN